LDRSARLDRLVGLVVYYRHIEAGECARRGRGDRLVGRELANAMEKVPRRSLAAVGIAAVDYVVEGIENAKEDRRNLVVEEEGLNSWAEEGIDLEVGCNLAEEDIGLVGVGCSVVVAAGSLADLLDGHHLRRSSLDSTYCLCL